MLVRRDLIDDYRLLAHPAVLGAGKTLWPALDRPLKLDLVEERPFTSGVVLLPYVRRRGT